MNVLLEYILAIFRGAPLSKVYAIHGGVVLFTITHSFLCC